MDDDQDYWDIIQTEFNPRTVGDGDGWVVAQLMDGVYEVCCTPDTQVQLEVSKFLLKKLKINFKKVVSTGAYQLSDGRVAVCYLKKA